MRTELLPRSRQNMEVATSPMAALGDAPSDDVRQDTNGLRASMLAAAMLTSSTNDGRGHRALRTRVHDWPHGGRDRCRRRQHGDPVPSLHVLTATVRWEWMFP